MSHVRKSASGRWEARYRGPDARERSKRFATKRDAVRFLERVGNDRQRGEWRDPGRGRVQLSAWVDEWWAATVNLRPSSRARDDCYLRNHVLPGFGSTALGRITQLDVRARVADLDVLRPTSRRAGRPSPRSGRPPAPSGPRDRDGRRGQGRVAVNTPKTRAGNRTVPIPPSVAERLADHMAAYSGSGPDAFVFPRSDGGTLRANAGLPGTGARRSGRPVSSRFVRTTSAIRRSRYQFRGRGQPQADRHLGGHTSVAVVLDRYGHLLPGHEDSVLAALDLFATSPAGQFGEVVPMPDQRISAGSAEARGG